MQKKQRLLLLAGAVCILLGCLSLLLGKPAPATEKTEQPPMLSQLDTGVREAGQGAWTFSFSTQDFLTCCNGIYRQEQGRDFFAGPDNWSILTYPNGIHSDGPTTCYTFSPDPELPCAPTVTLYCPEGEDRVAEITVDFDEHGYTPAFYESYRQMCVYALKTVLPETTDEVLSAVFRSLDTLGTAYLFEADQGYSHGARPAVLAVRDGIGVYPYYAVGDWWYFCIIPVTEDLVRDFQEGGTVIYEIPDSGDFSGVSAADWLRRGTD